jgi:putative heme iron utilization protein
MSQEAYKQARSLFNSKNFGVLSTISVKLDGFPFGSVVPYCIDNTGMPVIYISTIAQHTKNISANSRCSITVLKDSDDIQAHGRITVIGQMEALNSAEKEVAERYYRHFPNSRTYASTHDFSFYRLKPISIRYIGGFGAIHWIEPTDFLVDNPFKGPAEMAVVGHMNADHQEAMRNYCEHYKSINLKAEDRVQMVGIDSEGFDVYVNKTKVRFDFDQPVTNAQEARMALVALSKGLKL